VPFSVLDVALLTGLPATREMVQFGDDAMMNDFGKMVRQKVQKEKEDELIRRKVGSRSRDNCVYKS